MHGHRKKTLFFIERLRRHADARGVEPKAIKVLRAPGCGNGRVVTLPIAEHGFNILGIDSHLPSIESARAESRLDNVRFEHGDFADAPSGGDFDAVILSDVLEHVDDPVRMLNVATRALKPDGIVLIPIPTGDRPYEIEQFLVRKRILWLPLVLVRGVVAAAVRVKHTIHGRPPASPEPPAYNVDSPHVQYFSMDRFRRLLADSGLDVAERRNGAFIGGDLTYFIFYFVPPLVGASLRGVDRLPASVAGTWLFECRRRGR